ncbi:MAG TPA: hypothetical protein EYN67_00880 [Flavobacteriales bacterium]|nr:hypothetical protein [Flavobacteriales bacterium]
MEQANPFDLNDRIIQIKKERREKKKLGRSQAKDNKPNYLMTVGGITYYLKPVVSRYGEWGRPHQEMLGVCFLAKSTANSGKAMSNYTEVSSEGWLTLPKQTRCELRDRANLLMCGGSRSRTSSINKFMKAYPQPR